MFTFDTFKQLIEDNKIAPYAILLDKNGNKINSIKTGIDWPLQKNSEACDYIILDSDDTIPEYEEVDIRVDHKGNIKNNVLATVVFFILSITLLLLSFKFNIRSTYVYILTCLICGISEGIRSRKIYKNLDTYRGTEISNLNKLK